MKHVQKHNANTVLLYVFHLPSSPPPAPQLPSSVNPLLFLTYRNLFTSFSARVLRKTAESAVTNYQITVGRVYFVTYPVIHLHSFFIYYFRYFFFVRLSCRGVIGLSSSCFIGSLYGHSPPTMHEKIKHCYTDITTVEHLPWNYASFHADYGDRYPLQQTG